DRSRAGVVRTGEAITFPGELRPDELLDRTGVRVAEGEVYDTVAGFMIATLERIPAVGDEIEIEDGMLRVQRMDGRRVDRIRFTPRALPGAAPGHTPGASDADERDG